uniref:Uncharacterized protein n=1 Tax=Anguilla anguilla TaxID=7936 RepID=A0A0E9RMP1_ANGAN
MASKEYLFRACSKYKITSLPNDFALEICEGMVRLAQAVWCSLWNQGQLLAHNYVVIARYLEEKSCTDSYRVHVFFFFCMFTQLLIK